MNILQFINKVLIEEIGDIQKTHIYLSYGLICQGIEFLGSLTDKHAFLKEGESRKRFEMALTKFFEPKYHIFAERDNEYNFYVNIRCALLHVLIPKGKIIYSNRSAASRYKHLEIIRFENKNMLYLIAEDFFEDFTLACRSAIHLLEENKLWETFPDLKDSDYEKEYLLSGGNIIREDEI